ncbi:hypothetical protein COL26_28535 [Bacillus thuringiensis]|uniref:BclA C-terminal domain-containing protein n=1 Tax=Bacillus thuringiensis TaxID=1428 RepID=A0ABD6SC42_BACTU|nr:hypothetical protein [Bacillus thuringiensis]PEC14489.1 hypothetical protein CON19_22565 [Bacillus thuringiensis]PER55046.1 hypothetical protein CN495_09300 [Bacillus thuringiensis]PEU69436.1 hypothetical protein CN411_33865 [Bacillus thuringiensis]PFI09571.1 hypothetical protein COI79_10770 [Bacillus thuringiensis]PFW29325.1 hypothetical protein COL26_28535 [Bacillus thuringiensis]
MNYQNDNNSKPCNCPSPTSNSLNVVQTTPTIVSVNSAIPLDTVVNSNGTAISFTPPTTVLLEGGRTYLAIYEVQVIIQPGGNLAGITMYLNNNALIGSGTSLGYTAGFTSVSAPAIFTTTPGLPSTLTVNVGPYSSPLNTLGLTLAVVALT